MATYQNLLHSVALRANALIGSQVATLETTYATATLTNANFKSADFPFTSFRDAILQAEQEFCMAVAMTGNHLWRRHVGGTFVVAGDKAQIATTAASKAIIGIYGAVNALVDGIACVEMPLDVITRYRRNVSGLYLTPVYYYKIDGNTMYCTPAAGVTIEVCTYDRATQVTAFNANGSMLLPDPAESGIVARALSYLFRDDAYTSQAAMWRRYSDEALQAILSGPANIVPKSIPMPVTNARAN